MLAKSSLLLTACMCCLLFSCNQNKSGTHTTNNLYEFNDDIETRWSSPENKNGSKGEGGKENNTAKGHAFDSIPIGATYTLLDIKEQGIINRMWITIRDRSPQMLRGLKLEMYWDGSDKPAVSVPFGDFFSVGLGQTTAFQNSLFANAEGRSFNCFIPMPFKTGAKIQVVNESGLKQENIFFDIDYSLIKEWKEDYLYFHAYWQRDTATKLAQDFEILPHLEGRGRFLGTNVGVAANRAYRKSWFGEGEIKIYLDDDKAYPTLNGTGTEDYIGTAWGQGKFINNYTGCSVADDSLLQWSFYRYHIPDPVMFRTGCRVTMQQLGGDNTDSVATYQREGTALIPIANIDEKQQYNYYKKDSIENLNNSSTPRGWTNFYRSDDVSAVAYFYLDKPVNNLKPLQPAAIRMAKLRYRK